MFNSVTAENLRTIPPVEGVDCKRIPQILSKVYALVVGLKTKYEVGTLNFEPKEIEEDFRLLNDLAFTLELYLESGKFEEQRTAIAFVAAMSHKLSWKLKTQETDSLMFDNVPSILISVLMFVIGGYIADAEELTYEINRGKEESDAAWRLKQDIILLVRGKLKGFINAPQTSIKETTLDGYAYDLLWNQLSMGIKELAKRLLGEDAENYRAYYKRVVELAVYVDEDTGTKYDFTGISRLARMLIIASEVLEKQSVLKVIDGFITTTQHYDMIKNFVALRPYLWLNHIDAIGRGFLKDGVSSVITFPTGAGKSTLAELKIIQQVSIGGKVVYIVPTHALENQVKNNMSRLLGLEEYKDLSIGREFTFEEDEEQPVMVMTPERCSTLLALNPSLFNDVTLVMMDEFHIIGEDGHRSLGAMYCLVSLLSLRPQADFVLVSAMVENGTEIAGWISDATGRECIDLSMAWKPTSQLQGCIVYSMVQRDALQKLADEDKMNRGKRKNPSASLKRSLLADPYCLFCLCNTWESNDTDDYYLTSILDHQVRLGVNNYWKLNGNRNQVAKELVKKFAAIGMKTIVFVENPLQANSLVKQLTAETGVNALPANLQKRLDVISLEFGDESCSYVAREMGVASHHSQLLPEERLVMESLFKGKLVDMMVATPTLAQGVNLPVDVVLIAGETRYDAEMDGQSKMDAHEILNAAGRAGRAGFRSQGAAILISNKVIGIEENKLTSDWFQLKKEIFSKGDQCMTIVDPFEKLAEASDVSSEQKMVLMKLNLQGDNERRMLSKSFYVYQLKQKNQETTDFVQRVMQLSSQYDGEERTPLMELSLKTGIDINILSEFYVWLEDLIMVDDYTPLYVLKLYCKWLKSTPESLEKLLSYDSSLTLMMESIGTDSVLDSVFIDRLWIILKGYMNGDTLKEISAYLNEKPNDVYITTTRKFVLRVIPELSYAFSVLSMVHIQYLKDSDWSDNEIPVAIKNFSTYLKEGVTSEEMLRFKTEKRLMRVECHKMSAE